MSNMLIQGGTVVDGNGTPPRPADVRIADGIIVEVAPHLKSRPDEKVFDAKGYLVTPGFVDVHTHYDGQATWDEQLAPSCWHGVTTVVMGNCGVGFAPVRPSEASAPYQLDGRCRRHSGYGADRRHDLGLGEFPRLPRCARITPLDDGRGYTCAAFGRSALCDGRSRRHRKRHQ